MVTQSWMHGDGWLQKGQNCALLNWPWKITQIQEGSLDLKWWWKKGPNQNPSNKTLGLPTMKGPKKGSPALPSKKKSIPDLKEFSIKNWVKITLYIPSEFIFSSSGNLELWGQPLGLLSCKKNCLVNLQGPSKCFIFLFLLVVWNPWAHKAMTMSDFGDEEVCTLHNYYFYVFLQVTS